VRHQLVAPLEQGVDLVAADEPIEGPVDLGALQSPQAFPQATPVSTTIYIRIIFV
jgi:hypothetical protein